MLTFGLSVVGRRVSVWFPSRGSISSRFYYGKRGTSHPCLYSLGMGIRLLLPGQLQVGGPGFWFVTVGVLEV